VRRRKYRWGARPTVKSSHHRPLADPALQSYVRASGRSSRRHPSVPISRDIRVVDDPAVNAFAIPGGFVLRHRGILAHMTTGGRLATVMGHEIGHVTARTRHTRCPGAGCRPGPRLAASQARRSPSTPGVASQALGSCFLNSRRQREQRTSWAAYSASNIRLAPDGGRDARARQITAEGGALPMARDAIPSGNRIAHINGWIARERTNLPRHGETAMASSGDWTASSFA